MKKLGMISATVVYWSKDRYGMAQHTRGHRMLTDDTIRSYVRNIDSILRRSGTNHIVLDEDTKLAVQVSGYNWHRGAFCDVLSREELAPYLT